VRNMGGRSRGAGRGTAEAELGGGCSSSPGKHIFLLTTVSGARAEVRQWGTARGGTGVGGWSCGSGVAGDAVGVGLEVELG